MCSNSSLKLLSQLKTKFTWDHHGIGENIYSSNSGQLLFFILILSALGAFSRDFTLGGGGGGGGGRGGSGWGGGGGVSCERRIEVFCENSFFFFWGGGGVGGGSEVNEELKFL